MKRLQWLTLGVGLLAGWIFLAKRIPSTIAAGKGCVVPVEWLKVNETPSTPIADQRPPDQTFLTFPEWFLVHGPAEQAEYFNDRTSTNFSFMIQVSQFWKSYRIVKDQISGHFKFNTGYHMMIIVIGVSTTVEYCFKAVYETVVGRVTDPSDGVMTEEDRFNATFNNDYVAFIRVRPWYEFDFRSRLTTLWRDTGWSGPHLIRKWERKCFLTSELVIKIIYGWLIGLGTQTAYEEAKPNTVVVVDNLPDGFTYPDVEVVRALEDGTTLMSFPRYAAFNPAVTKLVLAGGSFREIAGNNSAILITVLSSGVWKPSPDQVEVFTQSISTKAGLQRKAIVTTVTKLDIVIRQLVSDGVIIEHIYDY